MVRVGLLWAPLTLLAVYGVGGREEENPGAVRSKGPKESRAAPLRASNNSLSVRDAVR